jgi:hypothetical protein
VTTARLPSRSIRFNGTTPDLHVREQPQRC